MRISGRLSAAIEILEDFNARRVPLKTAIADWSRNNRYAGAKDRAWISGLCLDVLRRRQSLALAMNDDSARSLAFGALGFLWNVSVDDLKEAAVGEHGPGALSEMERGKLASSPQLIAGDFPEWLAPHIERVFGNDAATIMGGFAERADIDLRLNTLKTEPEKILSALKSVKGEALPILTTAARIAAPDPSEKAPAVTVIPAFNKGWVEVQDVGSQIAAAAAGDIKSAQVLDYCAGGGGKTLALAAMMENTGQLYAYDRDPRRLKPLYHRARRAGVRNLQIRSPAGDEGLDDLKGRMDVVFVDAPCTGAGTWRRHPDTKWRLTPQQLERRMSEQDAVLREVAGFVKPGGRLIWVTCSFLLEENEDRLAAFLAAASGFVQSQALESIEASSLLTPDGRGALTSCVTSDGAIRLTPDKLRADGFFIAVLQLAKG
ncbi:MAG: RsmB/NOP family class I SAM-dependent RNA methyltransferase [Pseudomonadota bacterium]